MGVNIEMTPSVHYDHDVTLKIKIEVSAESGTETISGVTEPIISQRVVDQVIRLREGEASILGGIQNKQETENWTGIPGLSAIPDPQVHLRLQGPHHSGRRHRLRGGAAYRAFAGAGSGQPARHRHRRGPVDRAAPHGQGKRSRGAGSRARGAASRLERPDVGTIPAQSAIEAAPRCWRSCAPIRRLLEVRQPLRKRLCRKPVQRLRAGSCAASPATSLPAPAAPPRRTRWRQFCAERAGGPMAAGASFQVPVVLNGGADVTSIALQLHYDPTKTHAGQRGCGGLPEPRRAGCVCDHTDEPVGNLTIVASRPPGTRGVSGAGVVCVLTFQAKAAGQSGLTITRASW